MIDINEFKKLKPKFDYEKYEQEPFEMVYPRIKAVLPNFPLCVIEQWPYRHFLDFCNKYWWLEYDRLTFDKVRFSKNQIMSIGTKFLNTQDYWGDDFINHPEFRVKQTWLGGYMNENKTWPKPVIVLDTCNGKIRESDELCKPLHLLEGHMRLAYMRAFIRYNITGVNDIQEVWLVSKP